MISDETYKLIFEFKKLALWNLLRNSQIFSLKLKNNKTVYCSVSGSDEALLGISIFVGEEGLNSLLKIIQNSDNFTKTELFHFPYSLNYYKLEFVDKNSMPEEIFEEIQEFTRKNKISMREKFSYPRFTILKENYVGWPFIDEKEELLYQEVLEKIILIQKKIGFEKIQIEDLTSHFMIPLFAFDNEIIFMENIKIPNSLPINYKFDINLPEKIVEQIKHSKKNGYLNTELVMSPQWIRKNPKDKNEIPQFPFFFSAMTSTKKLLEVSMFADYEKNASNMLVNFAQAMIAENFFPSRIYVRDQKTYYLLQEFCEKTEIKIVRKKLIPIIDEIYSDFCKSYKMNENNLELHFDEYMEMISKLKIKELKSLSKNLLVFLKNSVGQKFLPLELENKIKKI